MGSLLNLLDQDQQQHKSVVSLRKLSEPRPTAEQKCFFRHLSEPRATAAQKCGHLSLIFLNHKANGSTKNVGFFTSSLPTPAIATISADTEEV